jgi:hypothetical protein
MSAHAAANRNHQQKEEFTKSIGGVNVQRVPTNLHQRTQMPVAQTSTQLQIRVIKSLLDHD